MAACPFIILLQNTSVVSSNDMQTCARLVLRCFVQLVRELDMHISATANASSLIFCFRDPPDFCVSRPGSPLYRGIPHYDYASIKFNMVHDSLNGYIVREKWSSTSPTITFDKDAFIE